MGTLKSRDIMSSLMKKGFVKSGGDHLYFTFHTSETGAKTPIFTKLSHSQQEVGGSLIAQMARQCRLSKQDLQKIMKIKSFRNSFQVMIQVMPIAYFCAFFV